jgi:hypothetical protein
MSGGRDRLIGTSAGRYDVRTSCEGNDRGGDDEERLYSGVGSAMGWAASLGFQCFTIDCRTAYAVVPSGFALRRSIYPYTFAIWPHRAADAIALSGTFRLH